MIHGAKKLYFDRVQPDGFVLEFLHENLDVALVEYKQAEYQHRRLLFLVSLYTEIITRVLNLPHMYLGGLVVKACRFTMVLY